MDMPKHSDAAKTHFRSVVSEAPGVEVKPMFGSLGASVNGNMYAGLFGEDIGVKLDDEGLAELRGVDGTRPFGPESRPMNGWLSVPAWFDDDEVARWVDRARDHIATLPPKVKKPKT